MGIAGRCTWGTLSLCVRLRVCVCVYERQKHAYTYTCGGAGDKLFNLLLLKM